MKVVMIGSGNVATVLGKLVLNAGHQVIQVFSRNAHNAALLADQLQAAPVADIAKIDTTADIYIIAVSDNAISDIAKDLQLQDKIVVHTSGAAAKNMLQSCSVNYGVLYPLQSIRKEKLHTPVLPFLIDGANDYTCNIVKAFAESFSSNVFMADDTHRLKLHIAAVFVSNFTNHLYAITHTYCDKESVPFNMLIPLIQETAMRLTDFRAKEVQTGPAVRNDHQTIERHLEELEAHPEMKELYALFTESIKETHLK